MRRLMKKQCERDIALFALHFFAHHARLPFGEMHREMFRLYRKRLWEGELEKREGRRFALAAPRGAAKSTLNSLIFPLHALLYHRERYILLLSATLKQVRQRLQNIQTEILTNGRLQRVFEEEFRAGQRKLRGDQLLLNDCRIEGFSAGTEIRGISFRQWRPSLIILDDIEDSRSAKSLHRREKLREWYNEVVENLGDGYTDISIVGTLLHPDSLLAGLLKRPDFEGRIFRSIAAFAERADLWDEWRRIFSKLEEADRMEQARRFFNKNRREMLRGTQVIWQAKEDYYALMVQMLTKGRAAFFKEKQNEPGAAEDAFFDMGRIQKFLLRGESLVLEERKSHDGTNP